MPETPSLLEPIDPDFEALLDYLKRNRGFDFTGYKRSSLIRRISKRMQMVNVENWAAYVDYLEVHPKEFAHLFNMILINVTAFFRDLHAWEYVQNELLPQLAESKSKTGPVRIWSAGCASGEEAYTLAMAVAESLGMEAFRDRIKIYATDLDEEALATARLATYTTREIGGVPEPYVERYFEQQHGNYVFHRDLRRGVIFGRHDLIQDAPISRVDLLVCRNALMYFNAEVQSKILSRLHFALNPGGFLFLGKAEMLFTHTNLFTPLDLKRRIFVKVPNSNIRSRTMATTYMEDRNHGNAGNDRSKIKDTAFDLTAIAQIVVDMNGIVCHINERARALFHLSVRDAGRPLQDLELSYRPIELRSCIEEALAQRLPVTKKEIPGRRA